MDESEARQMKCMVFCLGITVACMAPAITFAQQENTSATLSTPPIRHDATTHVDYREPLAGNAAGAAERPRPTPRSPVPVFPSGPTTGERVSTAALGFAAKSAFFLAASRTGTTQPVPAPSYAPYRPGLPKPEPGAEAIPCEPAGAVTTPAACAGR
jgi:hypothetical protein